MPSWRGPFWPMKGINLESFILTLNGHRRAVDSLKKRRNYRSVYSCGEFNRNHVELFQSKTSVREANFRKSGRASQTPVARKCQCLPELPSWLRYEQRYVPGGHCLMVVQLSKASTGPARVCHFSLGSGRSFSFPSDHLSWSKIYTTT